MSISPPLDRADQIGRLHRYADLRRRLPSTTSDSQWVERVQADAAVERRSLFKEIREQLADIQKVLAATWTAALNSPSLARKPTGSRPPP